MSRGLKIVLIVTLALIILLISKGVASRQPAVTGEQATLVVGGHTIILDIADEWAERVRGLSGRDNLPDDRGLLFVFEEPDQHGIWMKDMNFAIDIIWLKESEEEKGKMQIVDIARDILPETYPNIFRPDEPALYVIELSAGVSRNIGLEDEDMLDISFKDGR